MGRGRQGGSAAADGKQPTDSPPGVEGNTLVGSNLAKDGLKYRGGPSEGRAAGNAFEVVEPAKGHGEPGSAWLHPADLKMLGLSQGDAVRIQGPEAEDTVCIVLSRDSIPVSGRGGKDAQAARRSQLAAQALKTGGKARSVRGQIELNEQTRANVKVKSLGTKVTVTPIRFVVGQHVKIKNEGPPMGRSKDVFAEFIRPYFEDSSFGRRVMPFRPCVEGDVFEVYNRSIQGKCKFSIVSTSPPGYCISAPITSPITIEHINSGTTKVIGSDHGLGVSSWMLPWISATKRDILAAVVVGFFLVGVVIGSHSDVRVMYGAACFCLAVTVSYFVYEALDKQDAL